MLALLLLPSHVVVAAGQREDPVQAARVLMAEGRVNEAIVLLQDTVRRNPDRIEEAERLLSEIRAVRGRYNDVLDRLLAHLAANPEDIVTTLSIIDELEALDQHPNERIAQQVGLARFVAQLAYDRSIADAIMRDAAELLDQERYVEAIDRYLSGFTLQREQFESRGYPALISGAVDRSIALVRSEATAFQQQLDQRERAHQELLQVVDVLDFGGIEVAVNRLDILKGDARRIEAQVVAAGETISGQRAVVPAVFPDDPVDWHMVLLEQFILGRPQQEEHEGVAGAMRLLSERQQQEWSPAVDRKRRELMLLAETHYGERRWTEARERYNDIRELSRFGVSMSVAGVADPPDVAELDSALERLDAAELEVYLLHHAGYRASQILGAVTVGLEMMDAALEDAADTVDALRVQRVALADAETLLDERRAGWAATVALYPLDAPVFPESAADTVERSGELLNASHAEVRRAETDTVRTIGNLRYGQLSAEYLSNDETYQLAVQRIEGVEVDALDDADDEEGGLVFRYPREALDDLQAAAEEIDTLRSEAEALISLLEAERDYVRRDQRVAQTLTDTRELLSRLNGLRDNVATAIGSAQQRIATAAELRARGDQLVAQAQQALAGLDVNRARELWEQARETYFEALEVQEDEDFRRQADARIVALGVRLQEAENELIVQRVRELIDRADALYRQEDYRSASSVLNEARETWARTNVDQNPEIERLDRFVTAALTMESRRTLVATEPLYPVLSNYLNLAQNDYDRARDVIRTSSLAAAEPLLARAEQNLQNVTAVRPYNWEARLLQLEILRIVEADDFAARFASRVEEAWARRNEDPTEALVDLQALRAIDPRYPNLQSRIEQLEIGLGIRPDPITQAQIARSNQLLQQARNLAAAGGAAQVRAAISLLEEAVTLNPGNNQAKVLLDTLRIGTGGQAAVALSSADEQQFRRAETLFVEGNVAQAFAIVERLLQDENNRLYPPLLSLRQRIANRLGI
ncbi:MAG: hypothetical protein EA384_03695 [Spirochaetaceae bacterium]|nr:MAG: hypothetical protein EA384_03695 [Spirochaetaceae bacterium]